MFHIIYLLFINVYKYVYIYIEKYITDNKQQKTCLYTYIYTDANRFEWPSQPPAGDQCLVVGPNVTPFQRGHIKPASLFHVAFLPTTDRTLGFHRVVRNESQTSNTTVQLCSPSADSAGVLGSNERHSLHARPNLNLRIQPMLSRHGKTAVCIHIYIYILYPSHLCVPSHSRCPLTFQYTI